MSRYRPFAMRLAGKFFKDQNPRPLVVQESPDGSVKFSVHDAKARFSIYDYNLNDKVSWVMDGQRYYGEIVYIKYGGENCGMEIEIAKPDFSGPKSHAYLPTYFLGSSHFKKDFRGGERDFPTYQLDIPLRQIYFSKINDEAKKD